MIEMHDYLNMLKRNGNNLGQNRKNHADLVQNVNFTGDIGYRRSYILDPENGWHWEDIKFSRHGITSTSKSGVDSYIQFRPKVRYPIGTYLFIPDEGNYQLEINKEDPLYPEAKKLWFIVDKTDYRQFIRYLVVKCDYLLKWVTDLGGKRHIEKCWAACQAANSYTSGIWNDYYTNGLDNLSSTWVPDTHLAYGDNGITKYKIPDTRSLVIQKRLMITNNDLHPNCWMISKVTEMNPQGVLKISIKQDEFDIHRDNVQARVCDYYSDDGNINPDPKKPPEESEGTSTINYMVVDDQGFLSQSDMINTINVAKTYYFSSKDDFEAHWRVQIDGKDSGDPLERLVELSIIDLHTISLRLSKSSKLYNQSIILSLSDQNGDHYSSIKLEVVR